jgi:hypothetical protein
VWPAFRDRSPAVFADPRAIASRSRGPTLAQGALRAALTVDGRRPRENPKEGRRGTASRRQRSRHAKRAGAAVGQEERAPEAFGLGSCSCDWLSSTLPPEAVLAVTKPALAAPEAVLALLGAES